MVQRRHHWSLEQEAQAFVDWVIVEGRLLVLPSLGNFSGFRPFIAAAK